jgi:hypothetical protein
MIGDDDRTLRIFGEPKTISMNTPSSLKITDAAALVVRIVDDPQHLHE